MERRVLFKSNSNVEGETIDVKFIIFILNFMERSVMLSREIETKN